MASREIDHVVYIDIEDQHPDSQRFNEQVAAYVGRPLEVLASPYRNVDTVCRKWRYVNGPGGARCTLVLKKNVRKEWEQDHRGVTTYYWGLDADEVRRAERIVESMPEVDHRFPLIERGISKQAAHGLLREVGIRRPAMYDLGFHNNNCIGCVKGGMGYWNKVRVMFPQVFASRALMERAIGRSCIKGVFLDELDPCAGRDDPPISVECGASCQINVEAVK
jgi:hypothetical protein